MKLNQQQKALWANVNNIFNVLQSVKAPEEVVTAEMAKWSNDFEAQVPDVKVKVILGDSPRLELRDCSRDNAKTSRDASLTTTLRARIFNTRLTAIVSQRDSSAGNELLADALLQLSEHVRNMPFELKEKESVDLFEVLGIKRSSAGDQEDDLSDEGAGQVVSETTVAPLAEEPVVAEFEATLTVEAADDAQEDGVIVLVSADPAELEKL